MLPPDSPECRIWFYFEPVSYTTYKPAKQGVDMTTCSRAVNKFPIQSMPSCHFTKQQQKHLSEIQKMMAQGEEVDHWSKTHFYFPRNLQNSVYLSQCRHQVHLQRFCRQTEIHKDNIKTLKCLRVTAADLKFTRNGQIVSSCSLNLDNKKPTRVRLQVFDILRLSSVHFKSPHLHYTLIFKFIVLIPSVEGNSLAQVTRMFRHLS